MHRAKEEYEVLLETGELKNMFPEMKGKWEKDKKDFLRYHELNEQVLNLNVSYDEMEEGFSEDY